MIAFKQFAIDVTWFCWLEEEQKLGIFRCVCGERAREREQEKEQQDNGVTSSPLGLCVEHMNAFLSTQILRYKSQNVKNIILLQYVVSTIKTLLSSMRESLNKGDSKNNMGSSYEKQ